MTEVQRDWVIRHLSLESCRKKEIEKEIGRLISRICNQTIRIVRIIETGKGYQAVNQICISAKVWQKISNQEYKR